MGQFSSWQSRLAIRHNCERSIGDECSFSEQIGENHFYPSIPHAHLSYPPWMEDAGTQGSVLGPVLFLLYINDYLYGLSCAAVMFADDVKIWRTIESPSDVQSLQHDVDYLSNWSQGPSWVSVQISVSFLGCILDRRRTIMFSINWT